MPPCPGCGQPVDPLRAGHVAILDGAFHYFCGAACKKAYLGAAAPGADDVATAQPPVVSVADLEAPAAPAAPESLPVAVERPSIAPSATRALAFPASRSSTPPASRSSIPPASRSSIPPEGGMHADEERPVARRGALLDGLGIVVGALVPAVELLGGLADVLRVPLTAAAWIALTVHVLRRRPDPADPSPYVILAPTALATVATGWAAWVHDPREVAIAVFAGLASAVAILVERLIARARNRVQTARDRVERALDVRVRVLRGDGTMADLSASDVRPGEQTVVDAGECVGVDAVVTAGEARVVPWLDAPVEVARHEGDPIVAGARVQSSRLRLTATRSGRDRAWVRLLSTASTRIDVAAPSARMLRQTVERGVPVAGILGGIGAFLANASTVEIVATAAAGAIAFGARFVPSFVGLHLARAHLEALSNGITYKDARAFERAGATEVAVLSARGTVLLGEPEIVAVEPIGIPFRPADRDEASGAVDDVTRILSLAAGAETASVHPFAGAILRAARVRGVRADHVRNATVHAGLGITALASTGERLVVGGRAIMLEEKIGGAAADARVTELEAQGRSVLLVALGDRLVGLIALQDGLRAGARAAIQRLLDVGIEPVLLSGEARDTCDTIARALDIDHVRPEVLPADRGAEVRALGEGGAVVSVLGHPATDDGALGAADVAVAMGAAGSTPGEWAIALASDDVRNAAEAVAIPHATRARIRAAVALGATPGILALLAIGFGIAPLAAAPLAALLGVAAVALHAREA